MFKKYYPFKVAPDKGLHWTHTQSQCVFKEGSRREC